MAITDRERRGGPNEDHFTAVIEVIHNTIVETPPRSAGTPERKKSVQEVARLVVRADSIEALITKAQAHLSLLKD